VDRDRASGPRHAAAARDDRDRRRVMSPRVERGLADSARGTSMLQSPRPVGVRARDLDDAHALVLWSPPRGTSTVLALRHGVVRALDVVQPSRSGRVRALDLRDAHGSAGGAPHARAPRFDRHGMGLPARCSPCSRPGLAGTARLTSRIRIPLFGGFRVQGLREARAAAPRCPCAGPPRRAGCGALRSGRRTSAAFGPCGGQWPGSGASCSWPAAPSQMAQARPVPGGPIGPAPCGGGFRA